MVEIFATVLQREKQKLNCKKEELKKLSYL